MSAREAIEIVTAEGEASASNEGGSADNIAQNKRRAPFAEDVLTDELRADIDEKALDAVAGELADAKLENAASEYGAGAEVLDNDPRAAAENYTSHADELHTIFEIAGVDSSDSSNDGLLDHHPDNPSSPPPQERAKSPIRTFLQSERRAALRKAGARSDFEIQQLNQQIALTNQHAEEVVAMRRRQTQLKVRLEKEREEIAFRNERLLKELKELQETAAQISRAEAEVAVLAGEYAAQLQLLGNEKQRMVVGIRNAMQPNASSPAGDHDEMDAMIQNVAAAARQAAGEIESSTTIPNIGDSRSAPMVPVADSGILRSPEVERAMAKYQGRGSRFRCSPRSGIPDAIQFTEAACQPFMDPCTE